MNPPSPYIRDVNPLTTGSNPLDGSEDDPRVKTELVNDVPVKAQEGAPPSSSSQAPTEQESDQILKEVSHELKRPDPGTIDKKAAKELKKAQKRSGPQAPKVKHDSVLPIVLAIAVAVALAFLAYSVFKKPGGA